MRLRPLPVLFVPMLLLAACAERVLPPAAAAASAATAAPVASAPAAHPVPAATPARPASTDMVVYKSPTCGCCGAWVEHARAEGFAVRVIEQEDLEPLKKRLGVPPGKGSCHTAVVGGLVVEGHVPASDIRRLLADPGSARGLAAPGMPMGSPGMEMPGMPAQPYTVERIEADGSTTPFARHGG